MSKIIQWTKGKFPKASRRKLILAFVRHRYWFNQGTGAFSAFSIIPFEKIVVLVAGGKYILGDHVTPWLLYPGIGLYFVWRILSRWLIGYVWHYSDGYDVETEWNKNKVPPSRVEMINIDELALRTARYLRCDKGALLKEINKQEGDRK